MKKLIIASGILLIVLLIIFIVLVNRKVIKVPYLSSISPTPKPLAKPTSKPTIYPEYLLPTPKSLAPPEDPNAFEKQPKDKQEYSTLFFEVPINTNDYMVYFDFAESKFDVTVFTDQGMEDYRRLRQKYPSLKDSFFTVVDQRIELFKP
ncbi:hypothetical protein KBB12_01675 [Candidatus Woesebacteria bacterium]|nr:hypothetical protein [Candidatus Woesebacteria bacterium]